MDRDTAVARVNDAIGFRPSGHDLTARIILRFQEAQRNLEKGKTLPRFLLVEDETLTLTEGDSTAALPAGFLRVFDEEGLRFTPEDSDFPVFLEQRFYRAAVEANFRVDSSVITQTEAVAPSIYIIRSDVVDFITTADTTYTLTWSYYKAADTLETNIENAWLEFAPEWLIGEAGLRIAMSLGDKKAVEEFTFLRDSGRAAVFGEEILQETAGGMIQMGRNL